DGHTDRALAKATYPATLGLKGARRSAVRERDAALAALRPFGPKADPLRAIATQIVTRADETSASAGRGFAAPRTPRARASARAMTREPHAGACGGGVRGHRSRGARRSRASSARA